MKLTESNSNITQWQWHGQGHEAKTMKICHPSWLQSLRQS